MGGAKGKGDVVGLKEVNQGDIIHVEGIRGDIFVASKDRFNKSGMIVGCPVIRDGKPAALHIPISAGDWDGIVICEQLKSIDISARGYGKVDEVSIADVMEVTDAIQGIFDYVF